MRSFRHLSPRYIVYRLIDIIYQKRHPDHPWLTPHAISLMQSWLKSTDRGVEWGTGKSTVWFAERVERLVSVEHDPAWHERTSLILKAKGLADKVDYRLVRTINAHPSFEVSNANQNGLEHTSPYIEVLDDYPGDFFDFALVDGKLRQACLERALPSLRAGGLLILDNSERYVQSHPAEALLASLKREKAPPETWNSLLAQLEQWRTIVTSNGVTCTRFWVKPP